MEITARFVKEQDGTIKAVGVAKDISKRKFIEEERNTLIRQLEEAVTERDNLLKENKASSLFQVGNFSVSLLVGPEVLARSKAESFCLRSGHPPAFGLSI